MTKYILTVMRGAVSQEGQMLMTKYILTVMRGAVSQEGQM